MRMGFRTAVCFHPMWADCWSQPYLLHCILDWQWASMSCSDDGLSGDGVTRDWGLQGRQQAHLPSLQRSPAHEQEEDVAAVEAGLHAAAEDDDDLRGTAQIVGAKGLLACQRWVWFIRCVIHLRMGFVHIKPTVDGANG